MNKHIIILVGPSGSGKSTVAKKYEKEGYVRISQDDQGKTGHLTTFNLAVDNNMNIVVDRMGFSKGQRNRYLNVAKAAGYSTEIIILHENHETCLARCLKREGHPTIKEEKDARSALSTFFSKYERPEDSEADVVKRVFPVGEKEYAVVCDLDGTLCNIDHRLHFVQKDGGKKDWKSFLGGIAGDVPNEWCATLVHSLSETGTKIIYASGRSDSYRKETEIWLPTHNLDVHEALFMRHRNDSRQDYIIKEIILDFEILTRFKPLFFIDDRKQVVDLWRKRGFVCLQCHEGDF